jgi:hypothetical protein
MGGPNQASRRRGHGAADPSIAHRRRGTARHSAGQALVEFALVAPLLLTLSLGATDFGRAFGLNDAVNGSAREAARQAAYYDPTTASNPLYGSDSGILSVARNELGASGTGARLTLGPTPDQCFGASGLPSSAFPAATDTGYLYVCRTLGAATADGRDHIAVAIAWRMQLLTPIVATTGASLLHGIVDLARQSR